MASSSRAHSALGNAMGEHPSEETAALSGASGDVMSRDIICFQGYIIAFFSHQSRTLYDATLIGTGFAGV